MFSNAPPPHYSDLDAALKEAWRQMERGKDNRNSPFHTPVVASIGDGGRPEARVMVLRHADARSRHLRFHTDARSPKAEAIGNGAAVCVTAYDSRRKLQLRFAGSGQIIRTGPLADAAWSHSKLSSRRCYLSEAAPGTASAVPTSALPPALGDRTPTEQEAEAGRVNFAVLLVTVNQLDWLYLAHEGHRRAVFDWTTGQLQASWLAP